MDAVSFNIGDRVTSGSSKGSICEKSLGRQLLKIQWDDGPLDWQMANRLVLIFRVIWHVVTLDGTITFLTIEDRDAFLNGDTSERVLCSSEIIPAEYERLLQMSRTATEGV